MQDFENVPVSYAVEGSILENLLDLGLLSGSAALKGVNYRHGDFALTQVAGHRFSEYFLRGREVENVVDDLKCHAQVMAVFAQRVLLLGTCPAQNRSQPHADGKQACCFSEDQVEMLVQRNQLAELFHLQQLTFDHLLGKFDQGVENAEVPLLHGDLERLHVKPVAG